MMALCLAASRLPPAAGFLAVPAVGLREARRAWAPGTGLIPCASGHLAAAHKNDLASTACARGGHDRAAVRAPSSPPLPPSLPLPPALSRGRARPAQWSSGVHLGLSAVLSAVLWLGMGAGCGGQAHAADAGAEHTTYARQEGTRRGMHATPARTLLLTTAADGRAAQALGAPADYVCTANAAALDTVLADHTKRIAATLAAVLLLSFPFGVPASALIVAGLGGVELAKPVRVGLVMMSLPLVLLKARPRIRKLRFNLEEFAKSDFFKIFDFWKLLESALGGGGVGQASNASPTMQPMTAEREAALPRADPGVLGPRSCADLACCCCFHLA